MTKKKKDFIEDVRRDAPVAEGLKSDDSSVEADGVGGQDSKVFSTGKSGTGKTETGKSATEKSGTGVSDSQDAGVHVSGVDNGEAEAGADEADRYNELNDRYLRTLAEYDNYRKRTAKERESLYALAKLDTVEKILPVFDNLERAVQSPTQDESYKKGVELILQQMDEIFASLGVTEIEAGKGVEFNPEKHNAVMHIESDDHGTNVVSEVFQKGFECEGRVVRYATVQVAN